MKLAIHCRVMLNAAPNGWPTERTAQFRLTHSVAHSFTSAPKMRLVQGLGCVPASVNFNPIRIWNAAGQMEASGADPPAEEALAG
jgi:hypothetical protein